MANVLLVEDDYLDVISAQRAFKKLTVVHTLHIAGNGIEALELLRGSRDKPALDPTPILILLDLNMPKMNGIEFLKALRGDSALKHLPVFVTTTSAEEVDRRSADTYGVEGYIIKPLQFNNFGTNQAGVDSLELMVRLMRS